MAEKSHWDLENRNLEDLIAEAKRCGIQGADSMDKEDLIRLLREQNK